MVARLHDYEVIVDSSMLFGLEGQDKDIFQDALDFVDYVGVDVCNGIVVILFPGSSFFTQLEEEGRILTYDWSRYDGNNVVFRPSNMTPEELKKGHEWFNYHYYSPGRFLKRKRRHIANLGITNAMYLASR